MDIKDQVAKQNRYAANEVFRPEDPMGRLQAIPVKQPAFFGSEHKFSIVSTPDSAREE